MSKPRPTVRGKAGESTRRMQATRIAMALAVLILVWLALFLYTANVKKVMSLGLPATLLIAGIFVVAMKVLEKKGRRSGLTSYGDSHASHYSATRAVFTKKGNPAMIRIPFVY